MGEAPRGAGNEGGADVIHIRHAVHLHSRPHIDLQRVAGALCCS
ncbi:putative leader peptide [Streptomyces sp. NPDC020377]